MQKAFSAACEAAEIKIGRKKGLNFHDLRHLAAFHLVKSTDIVTASKILGHSTLDMALRYYHPIEKDNQAAVEKVAEEFFGGRQININPQNPVISEGIENRLQIN